MRLLNRISSIWTPGRSFTGKLVDPDRFWTQIERARFLLEGLRDSDLNWGQPYHYLRSIERYITDLESRLPGAELDAIQKLYLAWYAIGSQVDSENYEIDPWWLYRFNAAVDHIFNLIAPYLTLDDQNLFNERLPQMHHSVNNKTNIEFQLDTWTN